MGNYQFMTKRLRNSKPFFCEQTNSAMGSTSPGSPPIDEPDEVAVRVETVLDKKPNGELIYLDWNAFEPASVLREPELKDIHKRLCPQLEYDNVRAELRDTVAKKRAAMLAIAKDMVLEKILTECQIQQVKLTTGAIVTSKVLLNAFMKESTDEETIDCITSTCFKNSPRWKEDMTQKLIETFGIHYDDSSIVENKNRKGNGFLEKIVTKALNNVRLDLRAVQSRAFAKVKPERKKWEKSNKSNEGDETNEKRVSYFLNALLPVGVLDTQNEH
jgi:hypothetical protein